MKIGICGASKDLKDEILKKSFEIGKEIAKRNHILFMGAGKGYPLEAAKGAFQNNGKVIGISPGKDLEEHKQRYDFSTEWLTEIVYTGSGIPRRNFDLVEKSDLIIIIGGQIGTLNEFTIAFHIGKKIGILENSGGITPLIKEITKICNKNNEINNVVYSDDPKELVKKIIENV